MKTTYRTVGKDTLAVRLAGALAVAGLAAAVAWPASQKVGQGGEQPAGKNGSSAAGAGAVEVHFVDDSVMKLTVLDERLEVNTRYGRLVIPVADVHRIEFAFRVPDDIARQVEAAVADLGHKEFQRRESASAALAAFGERAYPSLLEAAKSKDKEVARRAEDVLGRLRQKLPAERLAVRTQDVVHTADSKISGRISASVLRVNTFQFGPQQMKLADIRGLRSLAVPAGPQNVLPDPGALHGLQNEVGKVFAFKVTGINPAANPFGIAGVWGSDIYTVDSALAVTAVHAGVLGPGETGVVQVKIVGNQAAYIGSTRNGVTTSSYGPFAGYEIIR